MTRAQTSERLIREAYECASGDRPWVDLLESIAHAVNGVRPVLFFQDTNTQQFSIISAASYEPRSISTYSEYYASRNVWLLNGQRLLAPGTVRTSDMMCDRRTLLASEYYNDFLRPLDISHALAATVGRVETDACHLTIMRSHGTPPYGGEELRLLAHLTPHLQQALRIHSRLSDRAGLVSWQEAALEYLDVGVLLVDHRGRLQFANRLAEEMIRGADGLSLRDGTVVAGTTALTARFHSIVRQAVVSSIGSVLALPRPRRARPLQLSIAPLDVARGAARDGRCVAMVIAVDPERVIAPSDEALQTIHGFTPAEARIAKLLLEERDLAEIAAHLGNSVQTVRSQLKSMLSKTATRRQSHLISILLKSAVPLKWN